MEQRVTDVTLYRSALEYLRVINITYKSGEHFPQTAFGYIASLTTELTLKAFLTNQGVSEDSLRKIGHSLTKAWSDSAKLGLQVNQDAPQWCALLNTAYDRPYLARYAKTNTAIVSSPQHEVHEALNWLVSVVGEQLGLDLNGDLV
ncbi:hypothetical protein [Vibrio sp. M260112]|uniref:hypothetical protein n=1 Tax=Vibrio sp. M260112 TaxID=3020895 RepID=UPI002F4094F6